MQTKKSIEMIDVGGHPMEVHIQTPVRSKPGPAVMLMFHRDGYDNFTAKAMTLMSEAGYLVAVPDVSHRISHDMPMRDRKQFFKDSDVVTDMNATLDYLATRPDVDKSKIVLMGHCMGGRMTMLGASAIHRFRAAFPLYGGGVHLSWGNEGTTPFDRLGNIRCPVFGFFGNLDPNPSPEQVDAMEAALKKAKVRYVFHRYDNAGHGFQNRNPGTSGEQAAANDAWKKTFAYLEEVCA
jgi:carboxymethylenebutenolidase